MAAMNYLVIDYSGNRLLTNSVDRRVEGNAVLMMSGVRGQNMQTCQ